MDKLIGHPLIMEGIPEGDSGLPGRTGAAYSCAGKLQVFYQNLTINWRKEKLAQSGIDLVRYQYNDLPDTRADAANCDSNKESLTTGLYAMRHCRIAGNHLIHM